MWLSRLSTCAPFLVETSVDEIGELSNSWEIFGAACSVFSLVRVMTPWACDDHTEVLAVQLSLRTGVAAASRMAMSRQTAAKMQVRPGTTLAGDVVVVILGGLYLTKAMAGVFASWLQYL